MQNAVYVCAMIYVVLYNRVKIPWDNLNLVRFAHNWNDGMMEYWNIGSVLHRIEKYHDS